MENKPAKTSSKKIVIAIPTLLGGKRVLNCLSAIKKLNYRQEKLKIVVVDNKTPGNISKVVKKKFPDVKVIINRKNLGFASAINQILTREKGDYFFVTNDDIVMEKESLKILANYMENTPDVGISGGKQLTSKSKEFLAGARDFSFFTGRQSNYEGKDKPILCAQVDGCCMLISKKVVAKIGLFDRKFFPAYGEDLDYCVRAKKAGFKIAYHPKAVFLHEYAATISALQLKEIYYIGFKNKLRFIIKHANFLQLFSFFFFHYLAVFPYRAFIQREPIFIPELRATIWNVKNFRKTRLN